MLRKTALYRLGFGIGLLSASALVAACGSGGTKNTGTGGSGSSGASGTGTSGASGSGTGGSSGDTGVSGASGASGTDGGGTTAQACYPIPADGLITDFTPVDGGDATQVTFGDFTTTFSGGEFSYPPVTPVDGGDPFGLTSDVTQGNWHLSGNVAVNQYSGWGLYLNAAGVACSKFDASMFTGVSFTVQSNLATPAAMTFGIGTAGDDIAADWLNTNTVQTMPVANFGRCIPSGTPPGQYDGTCGAPSITIPLTQSTTPTTVTVLWADLIGGRPEASVTPSELVSMFWAVPNASYPIDIVIDDLKFVP